MVDLNGHVQVIVNLNSQVVLVLLLFNLGQVHFLGDLRNLFFKDIRRISSDILKVVQNSILDSECFELYELVGSEHENTELPHLDLALLFGLLEDKHLAILRDSLDIAILLHYLLVVNP